ncbi:MAG: hypothetical protein ABSE81_01615 [Candidatus Omnitrophota bacterium]|jgi:hypothetical protein
MDKKDIYEHLAKIYLDASSTKKKKNKVYSKIFKNLFLISLVCVFGLSTVLLSNLRRPKINNSEVALILAPEALKINFNFDPAKKETLTLDLNRLNLNNYKRIAFSVKKLDISNTIALRVEFISAYKERSEVYLKNIPSKWQDYTFNLSDFKNITDWSETKNLSFTVEEWNTKENKGIVYIDNVRVLK